MKSVKTSTGEFFVDECNILHVIMFKNVVVDYEDAVDNFLVIKNITNNTPCVKFFDFTNKPRFDKKAKKFLENKEVQTMTKARAILTSNSVQKISLNFFIGFNTSNIPTKFFTNRVEALKWLKLFL
jgi:hypothetical protein